MAWPQESWRLFRKIEDIRDKLAYSKSLKRSITPESGHHIEAVIGEKGRLKNSRPLVISIAAGISSDDIVAWSGERIPCVRAMPNTPALVNCGVSGLYANFECSAAQRLQAAELMAAVGKIVWVKDESLINTVTGVSGSGPAYFFKMMELMMEQAMANGLDAESAHTLVVETALGAAMLIRQSPLSPADLRKQVTSPRGTTDAAINAMENGGIDDAVRDGVQAAISRSAELSEQFGGA